MTQVTRPTGRTLAPFRADHVGSLLRPPALLDARARRAAGELDADALRAIEDDSIRDVGPDAARTSACSRRPTASSGVRRGTWTSSTSSGGVDQTDEKLTVHFRNEAGELDFESAALSVHERISLPHTIFGDGVHLPEGPR